MSIEKDLAGIIGFAYANPIGGFGFVGQLAKEITDKYHLVEKQASEVTGYYTNIGGQKVIEFGSSSQRDRGKNDWEYKKERALRNMEDAARTYAKASAAIEFHKKLEQNKYSKVFKLAEQLYIANFRVNSNNNGTPNFSGLRLASQDNYMREAQILIDSGVVYNGEGN